MKKNKSTKPHPLPETTVIEQAYKSAQYRKNFLEMFRSTTFMLIVVAAFAVLVAILFLPILRIYGKSMKGTLNSGDWVDMDEKGNVYVNGKELNEPYLSKKAYGKTNITFPYQVPEDRIFVMGDNREVSIDSRNTSIGAVSDEQIVGRLVFKVWPLSEMGIIE